MSHLSESEIQGLKNKAKNLRIDIIKMITKANSGHTGGSLSVIDLLTLLFFKEMKVNPAQPQDKERDRFVLSKGHAAPALYAVLADKGYFPKEELSHLRQAGHILQGHPDMKHIPGVDMTTGSLGQGISAACGMALCAKIDKASRRKAPEAACVIWMSSQGSMRPLSFLHATEPRFMQFSAMEN